MVERSNSSDETERERKRPGFETACIQFIFQFQETTRLRYKTSRIDVIDIYGCIAKCELGEMVEHARRNEERVRARVAYEHRKEIGSINAKNRLNG